MSLLQSALGTNSVKPWSLVSGGRGADGLPLEGLNCASDQVLPKRRGYENGDKGEDQSR